MTKLFRSVVSATFLVLATILLSGCATAENIAFMSAQKEAASAHAVAQVKIAEAESKARIAEAEAFRDILMSATSDQAKALGAVVYAARGKASTTAAQAVTPQLTAPVQPASQIYSFASNVMGHAVQLVGLKYGYKQAIALSNNSTALGMHQSDNSTTLGISTNSTFASIAGSIPQPATNISTVTTTTTDNSNHSVDSSNRSTSSTTDSSNRSTVSTVTTNTNTLSGTGVLGSGSNAPVSNANPINYSLSGTGTVGSGAYAPVP